MRTLIAILCLVTLASAERLNVIDCSSSWKEKTGRLIEVSVEGLQDDRNRLILKHGKTYNFNITFQPEEDCEKLYSKVNFWRSGISLPVRSSDDRCASLTKGQCPLFPDQVYSLSESIHISPLTPSMVIGLQFQLSCANGKIRGGTEICFIKEVVVMK